MTGINLLDEALTSQQARRLRSILGKTPVIALPHGGAGHGMHPGTVDHLLDIVDSMAETLRGSLARVDQLSNEVHGFKSDLAAVGRVLALVRQATPDPYQGFERVHHSDEAEKE